MSLKSTINLNGNETVLNDIKLEGSFGDLIKNIRLEQAACESFFGKVLSAETNAEPTKKLKTEKANEDEPEMEEEEDEPERDDGQIEVEN